MADRYEKIRAALGMNLTPGSWTVANTNNGMFIKSLSVPGYLAEVRHCRTTQDHKADAAFIAACDPDTIRELLAERDALREEVKELRETLEALEPLEMLGETANDIMWGPDKIRASVIDVLRKRPGGKHA